MYEKMTKFTALVKMRGHQFGVEKVDEDTVSFIATQSSDNIFIQKKWGELEFGCRFCGENANFSNTVQNADETLPDEMVITDECSFGQGKVTENFINFPSGQLIIADSLHPIFIVAREPGMSLNHLAGQAEYSNKYAEIGCAFASIGNSSPDVFRTADGKLIIATLFNYYDEETGEETQTPVPDGWVEVASVCTDLWAYSIADYEDWLNKGGALIEDDNQHGTRSVVSVTPGMYKSTVYTTSGGFDYDDCDGVVIYGELELVKN